MKCPFCGAPITPKWGTEGILRFTCGSMLHDSAPSRRHQTARCVETEVGKLEARIEKLEKAGDALASIIGPPGKETWATDDEISKAWGGWKATREDKP